MNKVQQLQVDFDYDFELICLVSSLRDYRLCWMINKALDIDLFKIADLEKLDAKKMKLSYFGLYKFEEDLNFLQYYLISNKAAGACLLPEMKKIDYFLMLKGDPAGLTKTDVLTQLKEIPHLQSIFDVDPNKLPSRHYLIFE